MKLPTKIKFFGWLLHHERLNTRAFLYRRNIKSREDSSCEQCTGILETADHIFNDCPCAMEVWHRIKINMRPGGFRQPWSLWAEVQLPDSVQMDVIVLVLWQIWKARNALIFDHKLPSPSEIIRKALDDLTSWKCRYKDNKEAIAIWGDYLYSCL
ncbi:hypothetical protein HU200_043230 [Digitaria exilis]|uniref:Reverse transcriptase zinc-binding domain-containing protein n=1 Tax=Digitaria exilis TaxID=1010633 RepID=A0A835B4J9_9POAL|nr:hypothetical protein HU200_043230 [Digitaria exilis]